MSEINNISDDQSAKLLEDELFDHCQSYSLSEEGIREIIRRHGGLTTKNLFYLIMSGYEFFHATCRNERVTEGIIQYILEYFPQAARATNNGWTPLHSACLNKSVTLVIIQLLIDAAPKSVRRVSKKGNMPLHILCYNSKVDEATAIQIMKLLLEKCPESVRHADNGGLLPIHIAVSELRSPEFCRVLIEAYPGSERITTIKGELPLHWACYKGSLATVKYLCGLSIDSINHAATTGHYPIHDAIRGTTRRNISATAVEIVQFLLDCDPNQKLIQFEEESLLHYACKRRYNDSSIEAGVQMIKIVYDAHPEAIEERIVDDRTMRGPQRSRQRIQAFINNQLVYARQAKDHRLMMTPDYNGQLPLHTSLQNNVRLGSIKLLVKGNPSAIRNIDDSGALPLHVACEHHDSANVVGYILGLARITRDATDSQGNTALHLACRGAKHETIALLLEKYDAASVSKRNADDKFPIDLLWESNAVEDRESIEYTGSVFQLLRAYPEMVQSAMR